MGELAAMYRGPHFDTLSAISQARADAQSPTLWDSMDSIYRAACRFLEPEKRRWLATVHYQTPGGNASAWRGEVEAVDEDSAVETANAVARRVRRVGSIVGGELEEIAPE
jgi:hypothetical protein